MTTTTPTTPASNSEGRLDAVKRDMALLGKAEAMGVASRPTAGLKLADYAFNGTIDPTDAETAYDTYLAGMSRVSAKNPLAVSQSAGSRNAQVSKFRVFIKVGGLPAIDARDTLNRAATLVDELTKAGSKTLSPFDALLAVGRKQIDNPDRLLSEEEITAAVSKPEKAAKELIDKLIAAYKTAHKLHEEANMASTAAAVSDYADAIVECGGEIPAMTKADKEQAAFMAKAKAMGFVPMAIAYQHAAE